MAILVMIFRKMIKNKWLELSLLSGLVLSVALVSSMPIYTEAILQRMLIKDLEQIQTTSGLFPGAFWTSAYMSDLNVEERQKYMNQIDQFMIDKAIPSFSLPYHSYVVQRATETLKLVPVDKDKVDSRIRRSGYVDAMSDMQTHIKLIDGRMPKKEPVDGIYEALVTEQALTNLKMVLGNVFTFEDKKLKQAFHIKPVGVFTRKEGYDYYFYSNSLSSYKSAFFIDFDLFEKDISTGHRLPIISSYWYTWLDYTKMDLSSIKDYLTTNQWVKTVLSNRFINYNIKAPALQTLGKYYDREKMLRTMLWSLNIPVLIMLGFYLFMVSNLITDRQKTEIAVLRSRGASRWQILLSFIIEGILLGAIAFVIGPFVGMIFTKVLGASNGFLEFVQRDSLQVSVNKDAFKYGLIAVISSVIMTLIPTFMATRISIVGHKQQVARNQKRSFFHKFFIDIILTAVSLYGLNNFNSRMKDMQQLGLESTDLKVDPLLFLVPALFILGMGLFILRVYPWSVRLVYWIGRKWWPPSLYSTLIQVGRSIGQYQFLMVFLIITISTGLFSASAARTLNQNTLEKISYKNGADLLLKVKWENDAPLPLPPGAQTPIPNPNEFGVKKKVQYSEPPFEPLTQLPGVEQAARVFTKENARFEVAGQSGSTTLVGIKTDEFGRTAWFKDSLLQHHINDYLNLLSTNPSAVLVSSTLAKKYGIKEGDPIYVGWDGVDERPFIIYGILDFFPGFNPNPPGKNDESANSPLLIVGNLDHIQTHLALEPYDVWIKLKPDALIQPLYDALDKQKIPVLDIKNTRDELRAAKNDPFQLSINGVMTLGFLISIIICFFGFLLYWILSLSGRILQLGILRAMGISYRQLIGMLVTEQVLTSGAAILIGVLTGKVASYLFVPLFQISFNPSQQVPPFEVIQNPNDTLQLYLIVTFMIAVGLFILGYLLSRIKIHQAVKLGED